MYMHIQYSIKKLKKELPKSFMRQAVQFSITSFIDNNLTVDLYTVLCMIKSTIGAIVNTGVLQLLSGSTLHILDMDST